LETMAKCPAPYSEEAFFLALKGECLWQLGYIEEAVALVDRALQADFLLLSALRLRASIYLAQEQPEKALPLLLRSVRVDPVNNQVRKLLSQTYSWLGDAARAEEQMKWRD